MFDIPWLKKANLNGLDRSHWASNDNLIKYMDQYMVHSGEVILRTHEFSDVTFYELGIPKRFRYAISFGSTDLSIPQDYLMLNEFRDELIEWCKENFGIDESWSCNGYRFFFMNRVDMMRFKLAWA